MTDRDHVRELADMEDLNEIDWAGLTDEERDEFMALMDARIVHKKEKLEALEAENRALKALLRLQVRNAPGMTVPEAIGSGRIGLLEVVHAISGAVPDALAGPLSDQRGS